MTTNDINTAAIKSLQECLDAMINGVGERLPINRGTWREESDWQDAIRNARKVLESIQTA